MKKREKIVIFGAGGHGRVVLDILAEAGADTAGFIDEDIQKAGSIINGFKVLGDWKYLEGRKDLSVALGIGDNEMREKIFRKAKKFGLDIRSAVHPKAVISRTAKLGEGVVIMAGAVVNTGAALEDGVVVNTGATVDHDCRLGRFCQLWPGSHLAGTVSVGEFSYIGTGASVINNIRIGREVTVGAGAAVISDIPDNVKAVGVPAKII